MLQREEGNRLLCRPLGGAIINSAYPASIAKEVPGKLVLYVGGVWTPLHLSFTLHGRRDS